MREIRSEMTDYRHARLFHEAKAVSGRPVFAFVSAAAGGR
jgi:hypothetical protein